MQGVRAGYGLVQPGGGVAVGRPGGPECLWLVSPQPQPGRVPDALVLSLGAAARALTATSLVSFVAVSRSAIASFAVAIPFVDFTCATDEACSGNVIVAAVSISSAEIEALVAREAVSFRVDAPATCARRMMTATVAAISQTARPFMRAAPLRARGSDEFPPTDD